MIDPKMRDIVPDEHVEEVVEQGARLHVMALETAPQVKDPRKELRVGKCAQ